MSDLKRGKAAIEAAAEHTSGNYRAYLRSLYWKDDKEEHYVLLLNEVDEIPTVDMLGYIPVKMGDHEVYQEVIAKTNDPTPGESSDPLVDDWDAQVRKTSVAIAVELEPQIEVVKGRKKPVGFEVKTEEYSRYKRNDKGEATDEEEEVTAPVLGYIAQSPTNFFNLIANYDDNEAPVVETPLKITRLRKDKDTTYTVIGYDDLPVDLSNLVEYLDGVSYLRDDIDDINKSIDDLTDEEAGRLIGQILLDKRLEELLDEERYQELLDSVVKEGKSLDKFGNKKGRKGKSDRPKRTSSRRSSKTEDAGDEPDDGSTDPGNTEPVEEKPKRSRSRTSSRSSAAKASTDSKKSGGQETGKERMEKLRKRAAEKDK